MITGLWFYIHQILSNMLPCIIKLSGLKIILNCRGYFVFSSDILNYPNTKLLRDKLCALIICLNSDVCHSSKLKT